MTFTSLIHFAVTHIGIVYVLAGLFGCYFVRVVWCAIFPNHSNSKHFESLAERG